MRAWILFFFWIGLSGAQAAAPTADKILKTADDIRNPAESYVMKVAVSDSEDSTRYEFEVSVKGRTKTLIKTTAPEREKGKSFLMLDEDMWVSMPSLKRSVRVSLSQKLVGEAANGDISRMRWYGDYDPSIEKDLGESWLLALQAKKKGLTYEKIRLEVEKKGFRPVRAHFLTSGGKVFKKAQYKNFRKIAGKVRPTEIEITNATTQARSTIEILDVKVKNLSDSLFNQNNLR